MQSQGGTFAEGRANPSLGNGKTNHFGKSLKFVEFVEFVEFFAFVRICPVFPRRSRPHSDSGRSARLNVTGPSTQGEYLALPLDPSLISTTPQVFLTSAGAGTAVSCVPNVAATRYNCSVGGHWSGAANDVSVQFVPATTAVGPINVRGLGHTNL